MDRFCSVATGWNPSLTNADVRRRLPCEGALWEAGQQLSTPAPYFGVSDQQSTMANGVLSSESSGMENQASVGGFAYFIEATESLSLVTSFLLRQAIDVIRPHECQIWLMRFKELDSWLSRWKIYLPVQWKGARVANQERKMDPNLTLAHITHNTAVILLHQGIAYPSAEWQKAAIQLPSSSSVETCLAAASDVAVTSAEFMEGTTIIINSQFALCLFVCGWMLVTHEAYYDVSLSSTIDSLISNLYEIFRRWSGAYPCTNPDNLASRFAICLSQARSQRNMSLDIRTAAISAIHQHVFTKMDADHHHQNLAAGREVEYSAMGISSDSMPEISSSDEPNMRYDLGSLLNCTSVAVPPLPLSFQSQATLGSSLGDDHTGNVGILCPELGGDFETLNSLLQHSCQPGQMRSVYSHQIETGAIVNTSS